jgi:hypothetical protein
VRYVALEASKDALNRNGIGINGGGAGQRSGLTVNIVIPDPNGGPQGPMVDVTRGSKTRIVPLTPYLPTEKFRQRYSSRKH